MTGAGGEGGPLGIFLLILKHTIISINVHVNALFLLIKNNNFKTKLFYSKIVVKKSMRLFLKFGIRGVAVSNVVQFRHMKDVSFIHDKSGVASFSFFTGACVTYLKRGGSIGSFCISTMRITLCLAPELKATPCWDGVYLEERTRGKMCHQTNYLHHPNKGDKDNNCNPFNSIPNLKYTLRS